MEENTLALGVLCASVLGNIILFAMWVGAEKQATNWQRMEKGTFGRFLSLQVEYEKLRVRIVNIDEVKARFEAVGLSTVSDAFANEYCRTRDENLRLSHELDKIQAECAKAMDEQRKYMDLYRKEKFKPRQTPM